MSLDVAADLVWVESEAHVHMLKRPGDSCVPMTGRREDRSTRIDLVAKFTPNWHVLYFREVHIIFELNMYTFIDYGSLSLSLS